MSIGPHPSPLFLPASTSEARRAKERGWGRGKVLFTFPFGEVGNWLVFL